MKAKTILNKMKGTFSNDRFWVKAVLILLFPSFFLFFSTVSGMGFCSIAGITDELTKNYILQFLSATLVFIASALILSLLFSHNPRKLLGLKEGNGTALLLSVLSALLAIPLCNYITMLNEGLVPDSLQVFKDMEVRNDNLIKMMLADMGIGGLLVNLFLMALLPAVGEELFFRGMLLGTISRSVKNHHVCIWVTALFFSLIHLQLGKFIPIMLMGALFGYLRVWSKSLSLPVAAHFTNNSVIVLYYYFFTGETYGVDPDNIGTSGTPWILLTFAILFVAVVLDTRRLAKAGPARNNLEE